MRLKLVLTVFLLLATAALAHQGVKNPAVMKRMHLMGQIGDAMKVVGDMAKGKTAFDAAAANAAVATMAEHSNEIPALFETQEDDPKSEALPAIWEDFDDFTAKAENLGTVTAGISISSEDDLKAALGQIGGACKACHETYRE